MEWSTRVPRRECDSSRSEDEGWGGLMAWLALITLALLAEVSVIILLGRRETDRYESGQDEAS